MQSGRLRPKVKNGRAWSPKERADGAGLNGHVVFGESDDYQELSAQLVISVIVMVLKT